MNQEELFFSLAAKNPSSPAVPSEEIPCQSPPSEPPVQVQYPSAEGQVSAPKTTTADTAAKRKLPICIIVSIVFGLISLGICCYEAWLLQSAKSRIEAIEQRVGMNGTPLGKISDERIEAIEQRVDIIAPPLLTYCSQQPKLIRSELLVAYAHVCETYSPENAGVDLLMHNLFPKSLPYNNKYDSALMHEYGLQFYGTVLRKFYSTVLKDCVEHCVKNNIPLSKLNEAEVNSIAKPIFDETMKHN